MCFLMFLTMFFRVAIMMLPCPSPSGRAGSAGSCHLSPLPVSPSPSLAPPRPVARYALSLYSLLSPHPFRWYRREREMWRRTGQCVSGRDLAREHGLLVPLVPDSGIDNKTSRATSWTMCFHAPPNVTMMHGPK